MSIGTVVINNLNLMQGALPPSSVTSCLSGPGRRTSASS